MSTVNPEQTASILSLVTYSHLDPIVIQANRSPTLAADLLPPLPDYDRIKNLKAWSFPVRLLKSSHDLQAEHIRLLAHGSFRSDSQAEPLFRSNPSVLQRVHHHVRDADLTSAHQLSCAVGHQKYSLVRLVLLALLIT